MDILRLLDGPGQIAHLPYFDTWPPPEHLVFIERTTKELYDAASPEGARVAPLAGVTHYRRLKYSRLGPDAKMGEVPLVRGAEYEVFDPAAQDDGVCRHCEGKGCPACDARRLPT